MAATWDDLVRRLADDLDEPGHYDNRAAAEETAREFLMEAVALHASKKIPRVVLRKAGLAPERTPSFVFVCGAGDD